MKSVSKFFLLLASLALAVASFFAGKALPPQKLGIAGSEAEFSSVTAASVACSSANVSTSVLAAGIRSSFFVVNTGNNDVYLCRNSSACSATSSAIVLSHVSSTQPSRYEQRDNYSGAYTCTATTATTTITIDYSL